MRILLGILLLLALASPALAQPTELRRELAQVSYLVGTWEGQGWVKFAPDGERIPLRITSEGTSTLAGLRLAWKSAGRGRNGTYLEDDFSLRFRRDSLVFRVAFHAPGRPAMDGWAKLGDCEFSRGLQLPQSVPGTGTELRYTIRVDAANRLTEIGERSGDGGRTWWQFYSAELAGKSGSGCRPSAPPEPARTPGAAPNSAPPSSSAP